MKYSTKFRDVGDSQLTVITLTLMFTFVGLQIQEDNEIRKVQLGKKIVLKMIEKTKG